MVYMNKKIYEKELNVDKYSLPSRPSLINTLTLFINKITIKNDTCTQ